MTSGRILGLVLVLATATASAWLLSNDDFTLRAEAIEVRGLNYTSAEEVLAAVDVGNPPRNVFRVDTRAIDAAVSALPAVASAEVSVVLPDRLLIAVSERQPILAIVRPDATYLMDAEGFVLRDVAPDDASLAGLPVIDDRRVQFAPTVALGRRMDAVTTDANLRLASLTRDSLGTAYPALALSIDDADGYVLTAGPGGWRAVFGHYTPTLRPVDIIDRQVACLRARIAAGEGGIDVIYLSPVDDRCGTYLPNGDGDGDGGASASPSPRS